MAIVDEDDVNDDMPDLMLDDESVPFEAQLPTEDVNDFFDPASQANVTQASLQEYITACPDMDRELFKRPERVRAKKAGCWIENPYDVIRDLTIALRSIAGTEHLMFHYMKQQRLATFSGRYGADALPLVKLTVFAKSPAVQVLDLYYHVMAGSAREALPTLSGVRGIDDISENPKQFFTIVVDVQASLWKRQVLVYTRLPFSPLRVLHSSCSQIERERIIAGMKDLLDCDFDDGFTKVVLQLNNDRSPEEMANRNSFFMRQMLMLGTSKTLNSEVETNFARATSARSYMRGVQHDSSTMCAKHVLAEIAHLHRVQNSAKHGAKSSRNVVDNFGSVPAVCDIQGNARQPAPTQHGVSQKTTSWFLFRDSRLAKRPALIGETKEERRLRIVQEASHDYHQQAYAGEIENYRQEAQRKNKQWAQERKDARASNRESDKKSDKPQPLRSIGQLLDRGASNRQALANTEGGAQSLANLRDHATWGIPDKKWPVSEQIVASQCQKPAFIKNSHNDWIGNHSRIVKNQDNSKVPPKPQMTFCMKLGGCYHKLTDTQKRCVLIALEHFRNIVKAVQPLGKYGELPLVVFAPPALSSGSSTSQAPTASVFLLCQPMFRPKDICFWACELFPKVGAAMNPGFSCPSAFSADMFQLDVNIHSCLS